MTAVSISSECSPRPNTNIGLSATPAARAAAGCARHVPTSRGVLLYDHVPHRIYSYHVSTLAPILIHSSFL